MITRTSSVLAPSAMLTSTAGATGAKEAAVAFSVTHVGTTPASSKAPLASLVASALNTPLRGGATGPHPVMLAPRIGTPASDTITPRTVTPSATSSTRPFIGECTTSNFASIDLAAFLHVLITSYTPGGTGGNTKLPS